MERPYIVFVFDAQHPKGGWQDVLRKQSDGEVWRFATFEDAAAAGRAYWQAHFPDHGRFQVVDLREGKFVGSGGFGI